MRLDSEVFHLLKAWLAVSLMFAILFDRQSLFSLDILTFASVLGIAGLIVGLSFVLHELAHKYVSRRFGHWAEFRSDDRMLLLGILMSFAGFILVAPGAVMIRGSITKRQNGLISMSGPAVNLALAAIFFALSLNYTSTFIGYAYMINSWLAVFNLIPAFGFDGKKIFEWNKSVYFTMAAIALLLLFL